MWDSYVSRFLTQVGRNVVIESTAKSCSESYSPDELKGNNSLSTKLAGSVLCHFVAQIELVSDLSKTSALVGTTLFFLLLFRKFFRTSAASPSEEVAMLPRAHSRVFAHVLMFSIPRPDARAWHWQLMQMHQVYKVCCTALTMPVTNSSSEGPAVQKASPSLRHHCC